LGKSKEKNYLVYRAVDGSPKRLEFVANVRARNLKYLKTKLRRMGLKGKFYAVTRLKIVEIKR